MGLIRGHHSFDDHYTQIPNDWVRDDRLSLEARGLLAQIMSHRPGWHLSIKSIARQNRIGRDKVKRILDELLGNGYLERSEKQSHDEKGRLAGYDYTTRDPEGVTQKPCKAEPRKAEPVKVSGTPKNTISKNTIDKNNIDLEIAFSKFWSVYPLKRDKAVAKRAFEKALKRVDLETLVSAAEAYADDPNRDPAFTKYPASWLNADAWENGPEIARRKLTPAERAAELHRKVALEEQTRQQMEIESTAPDFSGLVKGLDDV